jgi:D-amino peptidase
MKVYISADMEGITGQVDWKVCGGPDGNCADFAFARRMMTHDVNAAIAGARSAGAETIVIKDSHGTSRNLLIDELLPGVELISGESQRYDGMMEGIDSSFDCAVLIGYHGMAGSYPAVMEHTISGSPYRMWWNDMEVGEIGMSIACAASYNVPVVAISSDDAGCAEFQNLVPGGATAITKYALGRYMARCLHPSETGPRIEMAVRNGIQDRHKLERWMPNFPVHLKLSFNQSNRADQAQRLPGVKRTDAYTLETQAETMEELHRYVRTLYALGL